MDIIKNRVYKHFKGDYYIVIDFAINNEDSKRYVIYRALYEDSQLFVREYDDFRSEVNQTKYPHAQQKYKFELQDIKSVNGDHK
jgi:hypothetical protein